MPCGLCTTTFANKPCNSNHVNITDILVATFNKEYMMKYFNVLNQYCPCTNCLVKMMCDKQRLNCEQYLEVLKRANAEFCLRE